MKISVVIAAYRGEQFIGEQIESLLNQTRVPDEIAVGDDSPAEATERIVRSFSGKFPNLRYERNTPALGVNGNFRATAEKTTGDLIFFCDQDDVWLPAKLEKMEREFLEHPNCSLAMCFSTVTAENLIPREQQDINEECFLAHSLHDFHSGRALEFVLRNCIAGNGHNIAVRRSFFEQQPPWNEALLYDNWLFFSAAALERCRLVPERLTLHRFHGSNVTMNDDEKFDNRNIFARLKQLDSSVKPAGEIEQLNQKWQLFYDGLQKSALYHALNTENEQLLRQCIAYLELRQEFRRKNIWMKLFPSAELRQGYRNFGSGQRSWLRDLIC